MIDAGKLDRRIELLSATETRDSMGDPVTVSTASTPLYAQRLALRTVDAARSGAREAFGLARYRIRYREGVTTALQVREGDKLYDIVAVDEEGRRESLALTLEEVTRQ